MRTQFAIKILYTKNINGTKQCSKFTKKEESHALSFNDALRDSLPSLQRYVRSPCNLELSNVVLVMSKAICGKCEGVFPDFADPMFPCLATPIVMFLS